MTIPLPRAAGGQLFGAQINSGTLAGATIAEPSCMYNSAHSKEAHRTYLGIYRRTETSFRLSLYSYTTTDNCHFLQDRRKDEDTTSAGTSN